MDTATVASRHLSFGEPNGICTPATEHTFKVLVIGDIGTGKTSIIKRYVHNYYPQNYRSTVGLVALVAQFTVCLVILGLRFTILRASYNFKYGCST